ncbi:MAG: DEAD/DEAH box helicase [Rhodobacteraceae bacterium]|nr:DEAD/DEAH box helicase [Paracoccaceae bacterium]
MTKFTDLGLDEKVLKAIADTGYETPTPIQAEAIPHALLGRDVLGIAQTGTGKTASFTLPLITILAKGRARARMPRSLILCPTRELAAQVAENFENYSKYHKLSMALLIGGVSFKDQDRLIDRGVDVLIATPGRLLDHFERGKLMLTNVQIMVVDEADRMLDMGFIPDIEKIFKLTPFTRQTLFFSATMAPEITRITEEFLHNPVRVEVARQATTSDTIEQLVCEMKPSRKDQSDKEKRDLLRAIMKSEGDALTNAIIFCNRKRDVDIVAKSLKKHGLDANPIHGDLDQSTRMRILQSFRDGELKFLVASDVAARGLDIPNVSHIFNFDVPIHAEDYVHRIGRTGRAGRKGKAITISLPHNKKHLDAIEELVKKEIPRMENPMGTPVTEEKPVQKPREKQPEPKAEKPVEQSKPANQPRQENRRNDNRNGNRRGRGPMGMGDHVPAFMTRPQKFSADRPEGEAVVDPVVETSAEVPKVKEKPKRRSRAKAKPPVEEVKETVVEEVTAAVETSEETVAEKPKRRSRTRVKAKAPAAEVSTETLAEDAPKAEKPKRKSRAKAKAPVEDATSETSDDVKPEKPKRKSRAKAKPKTEDGADAPAEKPKRKSRAKRKVEDLVKTAPTPAPVEAEKPKKRARITAKAPTAEPEA